MWCQAGNSPDAFWRQTPRSTVLALQGAASRVEAATRMQITAGYLAGMLTHCDPEKAPSLDDLLGENERSEKPQAVEEQDDPRANALAWIAVLGGLKNQECEEGGEDGRPFDS